MGQLEANSLCVDTNILVNFFQGKKPDSLLFEYVLSQYSCFLTTISVYELYFGTEYAGHPRDAGIIKGILADLTILPFDQTAAQIAAKIDARLHKQGARIPLKDVFIASICLANRLPLLTKDSIHFSRVSELKLFTPKDIVR